MRGGARGAWCRAFTERSLVFARGGPAVFGVGRGPSRAAMLVLGGPQTPPAVSPRADLGGGGTPRRGALRAWRKSAAAALESTRSCTAARLTPPHATLGHGNRVVRDHPPALPEGLERAPAYWPSALPEPAQLAGRYWRTVIESTEEQAAVASRGPRRPFARRRSLLLAAPDESGPSQLVPTPRPTIARNFRVLPRASGRMAGAIATTFRSASVQPLEARAAPGPGDTKRMGQAGILHPALAGCRSRNWPPRLTCSATDAVSRPARACSVFPAVGTSRGAWSEANEALHQSVALART
jgi:hypothetical protein